MTKPIIDVDAIPIFEQRLTEQGLKKRELQIKTMRLILTIIGLGSMALFIGFSFIGVLFPKQTEVSEVLSGDDLIIKNARFIGHSVSGGKVTINAKTAQKSLEGENIIMLTNPKMTTEDGLEVIADQGNWNQLTQELKLNKNVVLTRKTGERATADSAFWGAETGTESISQSKLWLNGLVHFERPNGETIDSRSAVWSQNIGIIDFQDSVVVTQKNSKANSQRLLVNVNQGRAYGTGGVSIVLPMGTVNGQSYEYFTNTNRIIIKGNARAVFN